MLYTWNLERRKKKQIYHVVHTETYSKKYVLYKEKKKNPVILSIDLYTYTFIKNNIENICICTTQYIYIPLSQFIASCLIVANKEINNFNFAMRVDCL